jgi:hypothetical protein
LADFSFNIIQYLLHHLVFSINPLWLSEMMWTFKLISSNARDIKLVKILSIQFMFEMSLQFSTSSRSHFLCSRIVFTSFHVLITYPPRTLAHTKSFMDFIPPPSPPAPACS